MNTYKNNLIKQKARYKNPENPSYIQYNDVWSLQTDIGASIEGSKIFEASFFLLFDCLKLTVTVLKQHFTIQTKNNKIQNFCSNNLRKELDNELSKFDLTDIWIPTFP